MKDRAGGLGKFLNEATQTSEKIENQQEQIIYLDIDKIETNPRNFYGLRDIEGLASLIAVSKLIEPLTVSQKEDGKYVLISGHRRRAAVQKLLEEGTYNNRMLPCIVKARKKIKIEQEDGEIVEFDEDDVDMLNLIASNRGQREERTVDEKLQEIKYLESFAKAIYKQKMKGKRGRFRLFFAEEILNVSKSQLQRITSMERLTEKVKKAIDEKQISESAALELTQMTPKEQNEYVDRILNGEIKGTMQNIQKEKREDRTENDVATGLDKGTMKDVTSESKYDDTSTKIIAQEQKTVGKMIDVPEEFDDPHQEAKNWFYQKKLMLYEMIYEEAQRMSEEEPNELKAAQWGIRASVAMYNIKELKLNHD